MSRHRKAVMQVLLLIVLGFCCLVYMSSRPLGASTIPAPVVSSGSCAEGPCFSRRTECRGGVITSHPVLSRTLDTSRLNLTDAYKLLNESLYCDRLDFAASASFRLEKKLLSAEDERALASTVPQDTSREPSTERSTLHVVSRDKSGDTSPYTRNTVTVRLDLRDYDGRQVRTGGHQIRMRMVDENSGRAAALHVTDMRNGSYVSSFPVLWPGRTVVYASIIFSRDQQHLMLKTLLRLKNPQPLTGVFVRGHVQQATFCGPFPVIPGFPVTCNLTSLNGGLDWFCGKPTKAPLTCADWRLTRAVTDRGFPRTWQPQREQLLINLFGQRLRNMTLSVKDTVEFSSNSGLVQMPTLRCSERKSRDTWTDQSPQGFWTETTWQSLTCVPPPWKAETFTACFRNTTFWFMGDSNARMMFRQMWKLTQCNSSEAYKSKYKIHLPLSCNNDKLGFKMAWLPHAHPLLPGTSSWTERVVKKSPRFHMEQIQRDGNDVILVHMYAHFGNYPTTIYAQHVRDLVQAVRDLHRRNPSAKVVVRGPHCWLNMVTGDYLSVAASRILREEFRELRDHVFYLDVWGMTFARTECLNVHPPLYVAREITRIFLGYVCPRV